MDRIKKAIKVLSVRVSDEICLRTLWRQTSGNRDRAINILREYLTHYGIDNLTDFEFDCVCGEMNNGLEVEWKS